MISVFVSVKMQVLAVVFEVEGDEKEPTLLLKKIEVFPLLVWSKTSYHTCTVCSQSVTTLLADVRAYYSYGHAYFNRPFPSSINSHFQNEAKCTTFLVKMSFICMRMKNHFHIKGGALNLVLIQRLGNGLLRRREKSRGRAQTRGSSNPPPFACSLARSVHTCNEKKSRSVILSSATEHNQKQ